LIVFTPRVATDETIEAGTVAVSVVPLTNVVVSAVAPTLIIAPETKLDPVAVSTKSALPAATVDGEIDVRVGSGLLMVRTTPALVPPPGVGVVTRTDFVAATVSIDAGIVAVIDVALMYVVASATPAADAVDAGTNPVPVIVSVNEALPTVVVVGEMLEAAGTG
jgi:hypothetical protein